jgi:inner membrane protein
METILQSLWSKSKLLVKGILIGILALILQIPAYYIRDLIAERELRQKEAITEVSSKWAGKQNITGPVLVLPYWQSSPDTLYGKNKTKHLAYFLPDELKINSSVIPEEKYRGIYKVMLYRSHTDLSGSFGVIQPEKLNISPENILWNEAYVQVNISDTKGLSDELKLKWNNQMLTLMPGAGYGQSSDGSLYASLGAGNAEDFKNVQYASSFDLNGAEQLLFTPVGKSTTVQLRSAWPHPSFTGGILPQNTEVRDSGFSATWKSLAHKRNFPQQWEDNAFMLWGQTANSETASTNINASAFGANLFVPVNAYQKTLRSIKYSALCILLTFAAFFLIETTQKKFIHPFQYGLIGLALLLFYTLLLSFSEYIGFNGAYIIASVCTIGLIAWFAKGLLRSSRLSTILSAVLVLVYAYVFTILQLQDYSLLLGSLGLFLALAVVMHFSKKIQW